MAMIFEGKSEGVMNTAQIVIEHSNLQPMPDKTSAHVQHILLDDEIGKPYKDDFFEIGTLNTKRLCQCE